MKRIGILLLITLTGCNPLVREDELEAAKAETRIQADRLNVALQRIGQLERRVDAQGKYIDAISDGTTAALNRSINLSEQIDNNAKIANENAVKEMNRRGACGSRPRYNYAPAGTISSIVNEKILCTLKDLQK